MSTISPSSDNIIPCPGVPAELTVKFCCTTVELPEKVFTPAIVWSFVKSTKFLVVDPVPPLAIPTVPETFAAVPVVF